MRVRVRVRVRVGVRVRVRGGVSDLLLERGEAEQAVGLIGELRRRQARRQRGAHLVS